MSLKRIRREIFDGSGLYENRRRFFIKKFLQIMHLHAAI